MRRPRLRTMQPCCTTTPTSTGSPVSIPAFGRAGWSRKEAFRDRHAGGLRHAPGMSLPQRLGYVTLGARSMSALRSFYTGLGWVERPGSNDEFATYEMGSALLALYPL